MDQLKSVFHKFYLVHSWIPRSLYIFMFLPNIHWATTFRSRCNFKKKLFWKFWEIFRKTSMVGLYINYVLELKPVTLLVLYCTTGAFINFFSNFSDQLFCRSAVFYEVYGSLCGITWLIRKLCFILFFCFFFHAVFLQLENVKYILSNFLWTFCPAITVFSIKIWCIILWK